MGNKGYMDNETPQTKVVRLSDEAADALRRAAKIAGELDDPRFHDQLRAAAFDVETATVVRKLRAKEK